LYWTSEPVTAFELDVVLEEGSVDEELDEVGPPVDVGLVGVVLVDEAGDDALTFSCEGVRALEDL
jgi:hypothetical protein